MSARCARWLFEVVRVTVVAALILSAGCQPPEAVPATATVEETNVLVFEVKGVVHEIKPDGETGIIQHEAIPDFMPAMVMPLTVRDRQEFVGLGPGDEITFRLWVTADEDWIDQVKKTGRQVEVPASLRRASRPLAPGELLKIGDRLPDITLTNELGDAFALSDLQGDALALTFIFTRCPLPDYCPLMSRQFAEAHQILRADPGAATNWQMLSVSFDPDYDTPAVLKRYADLYRPENPQWHYATSDAASIERLSRPLGLMLMREGGTISHNLRTVVADPAGRIHHLFVNNIWTPDELARVILRAAASSGETPVATPNSDSPVAPERNPLP